jgi:hypothetical protein
MLRTVSRTRLDTSKEGDRMRANPANLIPLGVLLGVFVSSTALAQSVITGVVKDASGGVLPGVTVEVSSSALIDGARSVATDPSGLYRVVDLRPGTYVVVFSLPGFDTLRNDGIQLRADFTATINAEMKVGTLQESVTVSGASPTVDLQTTARAQVMTRDTLDALPTGRSFQAFAALVPSVRMNSLDIGGARGSTQTYISLRGLDQNQSLLFVDGLPVNPGCCGQTYYSDAMNEEISYQTSSLPAEVSTGGVRINMIPKDGGNRFSGTFVGIVRDGAWQQSNLTQSLIDRGLTRIDKFEKIYDVDGAVGGPIAKNKVWFFTAHRRYGNDTPVADTFYPDGRPGIQDDRTWADMLRLTYQIDQKNKLTGFYNYTGKAVGHQLAPGTEPAASLGWYAPNYAASYVKWTSVVNSRLLLEVGPSMGNVHHQFPMQPGVEQDPFSAAWYASASRLDLDRVTRRVAPANTLYNRPGAVYFSAFASYTTGAHNLKVGTTLSSTHYKHTFTSNAHLVQQYRSGVADSVVVQNLPITSKEEGTYNHGVFVQDTWRMNRLTLTGGLRWEAVRSRVPEQESPAGRFVPERHFAAVENVPNWRDFAPRFGAVYDLTGDGRTAIKYSLNRYNQWEAMTQAIRYNPLAVTTSQLRWTDSNRDDIAQGERGCVYLTQGCEIDFSTLPANFGVRALSQPRDLERWYTVENGLEIQHALRNGLTISGSFVRGAFRDMQMSYNSLITPADFTPVEIFNPADGTPLTIYNLSPSKATAVAVIDTSSASQKKVFTGYTVSFNARLPRGINAFGGFNADRVLWNNCGQPDNPNLQRLCDDSQNNLPFMTSLKLSGSVPIKWGIMVSGSLQNLQGYNAGVDGHTTGAASYGSAFVITRTTRYPANCPAPCPAGALVASTLTLPSLTVPLQAYGAVFTERINEVEIRIAKTFRQNGVTIEPRFEVFNLLNKDTATAWRSVNYGTPTYLQPSAVPPARFFGVGFQIRY